MAPSSDSTPPRTGSGRSARLGQRVGPFQLVERLNLVDDIGLYRATRPAGSRAPHTVAIRIAEDARNDRAAAWVWHEYEILRRLDDPRIPKAYGYYSSQVGVATSLPPSLTLADVLEARRKGRIPVDIPTAVDIIVELAEALRHVHAIAGPDGPICHGHLNPASVGITSDGSLVILGLGAPPRELPVGYRPPEQVAGAFTDTRSDQWRLGAMLIELVLGSELYAGLDDPEDAATVGQVGPWVSRLERRQPALARIASKLLAPAAGNRYSDENTLVRDLLESSRLIGGQPDRRVLASRMNAIREAENRRTAEAATTIDGPRPPKPKRSHEATPPAARPVPEPSPAALEAVAVPTPTPVAAPDADPVMEEPAPAPTEPVAVVAVEMTHDDPSLGLDRVAVADQEEDGPSLGSNLPGLPHTEDPFNDPLEVPIVGPELTQVTIDGSLGEPDRAPESAVSRQPVAPADTDADAETTEVVSRPASTGGTGPRPNKWFPSELGAMAAIGIASLTAIAFLIWRFG